jgi:rhamnosyltransferase
MHEDIIAGVVTFNFDGTLYENVMSYLKDVGEVVIVDNNSDNKRELSELFGQCANVTVIYNDANLGIATALNQILHTANQKGYPYMLTMDQDSRLLPECVDKLYAALQEEGVVSVGPRTKKIGREGQNRRRRVGELITSGNMLKVSAVNAVGGYFDELFIDWVDFDLCLKLREAGGKLLCVEDARIKHSLGIRSAARVLFFKIHITQHSPSRYYYISRNARYIFKRFKRFFWYCLIRRTKLYIRFAELVIHDQTKEKRRNIRKGRRDAREFCKRYAQRNRRRETE